MKTLFEQSCEDWCQKTGGTPEQWRHLSARQWEEIKTKLIETGHWHDGQSCDSVRCGEPAPEQPSTAT